jgi:hypothetical protein
MQGGDANGSGVDPPSLVGRVSKTWSQTADRNVRYGSVADM